MSDESTSEPPGRKFSELHPSRLKMLWSDSWSHLTKGLLISAFLHFLLALPILFSPSIARDLEMDWYGDFGTLVAIGHGAEDFEQWEEVDWDDLQDLETDPLEEILEEVEEILEEEVEEEVEEEEDIEEEVEEEPEPEEESEPQEEVEEEPEPRTDPTVEAEPDPHRQTETVAESTPDDGEEQEFEELPGIDRSSPSNLPDLRHYGPGNARVTALVRTDRFRGTELEPYVEDVLRAVPDYYIALEGIDLDPIDELDSIFMASANPDHLHETFLAVRHRFENDELQALLNTRFQENLEWELDDERPMRRLVPRTVDYRDPRRLLLAMPGLALIGQPAWFEDVLGPVDEDSDLGRELAAAEKGPSTFTLLDGLARIEEAADREDMLVLVSAYGFRLRDIPMVDTIPPFDAARLSITDPENPKLTIDLRLRNEEEARKLEQNCPRLKTQLNLVLRFMGIAALVRPLECSREGPYVIVEGQYTLEEIQALLERAEPMIQAIHPPSLEGLPKAPRPEEDEEQAADEEDVDDHDADESDEGDEVDVDGGDESAPLDDSSAPVDE